MALRITQHLVTLSVHHGDLHHLLSFVNLKTGGYIGLTLKRKSIKLVIPFAHIVVPEHH